MIHCILIMLTLLFPQERDDLAIFTFVDPIHSLTLEKDGADVTLNWELDPAIQAKWLVVLRAKKGLELLPGDATSWTYTEEEYGVVTFTILWAWTNFLIFDFVQVDIDFGALRWTPPETVVPTGYYLYIAENIDNIDPMEPTYTLDGEITELPLRVLFDNGILIGGQEFYVGASSYVEYEVLNQDNPAIPEIVTEVSDLAGPIGPVRYYDRRLVIE